MVYKWQNNFINVKTSVDKHVMGMNNWLMCIMRNTYMYFKNALFYHGYQLIEVVPKISYMNNHLLSYWFHHHSIDSAL